MTVFKWGIIAPGNIAKQFTRGLDAFDDAVLYAVASRDQSRAQVFADEFGVERAYGSYAALITDPNVDAIYIASPHTQHQEQAIACLAAGKPVLCEKPIAVNVQQFDAMHAASKEHGTFLMEAMWTRFLPVMNPVRRWLRSGAIGDVRMVQASFGFRCGWNPEHRLLNPDLAGGALLDVGIYPVSLAHWVFEKSPVDVQCSAHIGATNVDEQSGMLLRFDGGELAVLSTAVQTQTHHEAKIYGTNGSITIHAPFWRATQATLQNEDGEQAITCDHWSNGYEYEAMEVMRCVRAGLTESPYMPLAESRTILSTLDQARAAIGLSYPFEV